MKRYFSLIVFWTLVISIGFGQVAKVGGSGTTKVGGSGTGKVSLSTPRHTFSTQPDGAITGTNFTQQPVVTAKNANGATDSSFQGNVTIALVKSSGTLSGTATVAAVNGVATFSGLKITGAGHGLLEATATGYTTVRSGLITVNPAATTAETVLAFGGATSDKIDCGSGSTLDNLTNAGGFFCIVRLYNTTAGANEFFISKYNSGDLGWALGLDNGAGTMRVQANMGRATTSLLLVSDSSNTIALNTWYDVAFSWDGSTGRVWRGVSGSAMSEVGYDAGSTQGSGTVSTDAGASCWIGNLQIAPTAVFKGNIAWVGIWNKVPTAQERLQIQMGFDARDTARITGVTGCKGLWQCNATGTLTDLSGNSNSGTVSGATTTTSSQTIFAPTVWGNSQDATNVSDLYKKVTSKATVSYSTTATSVDLGVYRNSTTTSTFDAQCAVTVYEGNTYKGQVLASVSAGGYNYGTVSLSAGSKTVTIENSTCGRSGAADVGVEDPAGSLVSAKFNASATELIPPTPSTTWLMMNDSVNEGIATDPVGSNGPNAVLRSFLGGYTGTTSFFTWGWGGRSWYVVAKDGSTRTTTVGVVEGFNPDYIVVNLGANDYINQTITWTPTNCQTGVAAWLALMHTTVPKAKIFLIVPYTMASGEGANPTYTMNQYRSAIAEAANGLSYVTVINGPLVWDGTNNTDGVHPNNTGAASVVAGLKRYLGLN